MRRWQIAMVLLNNFIHRPFCFILGPTKYLVNDADALKQILVTNSFKYHRPTGDSKHFPSKNVLRANGKEHARMRKMFNPVFKMDHLMPMVDVFHGKAELLKKVKRSSKF